MRTISVIVLSLFLASCTAPPAARDVLTNDRSARDQITASYAMDLSLTRVLVSSVLEARRVIVVGEIERAIVADGLVTGNESDPSALARVIGDPRSPNPIAIEVHSGHLTSDQAATFLSDYAALGRLSNSRDLRRATISKLHPVVSYDQASSDLLRAVDDHAAYIAKLIAELDSNSTAFESVISARAVSATDLTGAVSVAASTFIQDPTRRDAVLKLLSAVAPSK